MLLAQCEKNKTQRTFIIQINSQTELFKKYILPWEFSRMYTDHEKHTKAEDTYWTSTGAHTSTLYKTQPNLFSCLYDWERPQSLASL